MAIKGKAKKLGFWTRLKKAKADKKAAKEKAAREAAKKSTEAETTRKIEEIKKQSQDPAMQLELKAQRRVENMVRKAATATKDPLISKFVQKCKQRELDPKKTFKKYYKLLQQDEKVINKEFELMMMARDKSSGGKKVHFSGTKFYVNLILKRYLKS